MSRIRFFLDYYQQLSIAFYISVFQNESKFRNGLPKTVSNKVYPFYYRLSNGIFQVLRLNPLWTKMMHTIFYILLYRHGCN